MKLYRPENLLAGFHAYQVEAAVPELHHVGEQWASKEYPVELNPKDYWLFLEISGESRWEAQSKVYTVRPGNVLIMPPNVHYQLLDRGRTRHHFFFAAIDLKLVLERLPYLRPVWQTPELIFIEKGESLLLPFRQLVREVTLDQPYRVFGLRLAIDALILELSRLVEKQAREASQEAPLVLLHPAVIKIKQLLEGQPGRPWKLGELARLSGFSPQYLVKTFTREVGISPHQYLMQLRVNQAKELLAHSDVPVTQLALELGFSSSQHFATVYRRLTGETPLQYRSTHRLTPHD
jgi:AraC-like DNA-binding protein